MAKIGSVEDATKYFAFLDRLRASGVTNMYGATPYLHREFSLTKEEACAILGAWMDTFSDAEPKARAIKAGAFP